MNIDGTDLRDALEPLAGDPVQDAACVLGRLPKPWLPPVAWWLLAAGLLVGVFAGPWVMGKDEKPPETPVVTDDGKEKEKEQPNVVIPPPKEKVLATQEEKEHIYFYGFGDVRVKPDGEAEQVLSMEHDLWLGTAFDTDAARAGLSFYGGIQLRLDTRTVVKVNEVNGFELKQGQIWTHTGDEPGGFVVVTTELAFIDVVAGAANIDFRAGKLHVVCLSGQAHLRPRGGEPIKLTENTSSRIDASGQEAPTEVSFPWEHTSWMTVLLQRQQDQSEVQKRVAAMIELYFGTEFRDQARKELRKLGAVAVPKFTERFRTTPLEPGFARATAELICTMASTQTIEWVFNLLYHDDPEVRVIAYTRAYHLTDENDGTGDKYWREMTDPRERDEAIKRWWNKVK